MSTFSYTPSYSTDLTRKPKIRKAQFGDGYAQRTRDGINNNPQVWNLKFENLSAADADAIEAFLEAEGGTTPFNWTPPGKSSAKFVCEEWSRGYSAYGANSLNMKFEQDFAP